jgi:hypothetical protein
MEKRQSRTSGERMRDVGSIPAPSQSVMQSERRDIVNSAVVECCGSGDLQI